MALHGHRKPTKKKKKKSHGSSHKKPKSDHRLEPKHMSRHPART